MKSIENIEFGYVELKRDQATPRFWAQKLNQEGSPGWWFLFGGDYYPERTPLASPICKILSKFRVLRECGEADEMGWVVECQDGTRTLMMTVVGIAFAGKEAEAWAREKQAEYKAVLAETTDALAMLGAPQ